MLVCIQGVPTDLIVCLVWCAYVYGVNLWTAQQLPVVAEDVSGTETFSAILHVPRIQVTNRLNIHLFAGFGQFGVLFQYLLPPVANAYDADVQLRYRESATL